MKTEIISIGTEITTGAILNTNAHFLAKELLSMGIEVSFQTSVADSVENIKEVLKNAIDRADLIITSGGLGPTEDDMTKEVIADYLGLKLIRDEAEVRKIDKIFEGRENIPQNNYKQAIRMENSVFLNNEMGTASGIFLEEGEKKIILLPGPPRELIPMFQKEVRPILTNDDLKIITKSINITDVGESQVELDIMDLIHKYEDVEVATFGKLNNVEIKIIARGTCLKDLEDKIAGMELEIKNRYGLNLYAYDNEPIENVLVKLLENKSLKIGFAESCTGGLISSKITRVAGSSKVFDRGKITYSNLAKEEELKVSRALLEEHGAVSKEVAEAMLRGLLETSAIDLGAAVTGIAGPNSDSTDKPVGLVYIAIGNKDKIICRKYNLKGDRRTIQNKVAENTLFGMREFIIKNY